MTILPFPQRQGEAGGASPLPLFPLNAVLFPQGMLSLRVFEPRYMTLVKESLKQETPFGICLIATGSEVGAPAEPHPVGTEARIVTWDMTQPGILNISVRGGARFRILSSQTDAGGLLRASIEPVAPEPQVSIPPSLGALLPLLQAMVADVGVERLPPPHRFDDAAWVGHRFSELLPIPLLARQKLLELDDPLSRLEIIFKYLAQRGLAQ